MRTSRMIEMIYLLLKDRQQKAQVIADYFGVSTKTIYRDVETLAKAGIPITMQQGVSGGIILDERYMTNEKKLSDREEQGLMNAIENIKRLPNAQLEYALKMLKQYFNEAGTMWVNTDDVSIVIHEKFNNLKAAIILKKIIGFDYYSEGQFKHVKGGPYELRIKNDVWSIVLDIDTLGVFKEYKISRMKNIEVTEEDFERLNLPNIYGKKYSGGLKYLEIEINHLTDEILDRYPIEYFDLDSTPTVLKLHIPKDICEKTIIKKLKQLDKKRVISNN